MYNTVFWTLWERERVGWFGRMALKYVYHHIWNESPVQIWCTILDAWGWCTGTTQRDGMGREEGSGWGTHVCLWRIHFDIWQNQYNIVKFKNKIKKKKKKGETSCTVGGNIKWYSHEGEQYELSLKNKQTKKRVLHGLSNPTVCAQCSLQHYSQQPGHGSKLAVHWQMDGWRSCGTYIPWNIIPWP